MLYSWSFAPEWSRFFRVPGEPIFPSDAARRARPALASEDGRLALLGSLLPLAAQIALIDGLRAALRYRQHWPLARQADATLPPESQVERTRFGVSGEQLRAKTAGELRRLLREELRESLRTLEADLSRTVRHWRLAMHATRLGQLYAELARQSRRLAPVQALHQALAALCL